MLPVDPVCGSLVLDAGAPTAIHNRVEYRFCGEGCRGAFVANPLAFLKPIRAVRGPAPVEAGARGPRD